jgi:hypothetical protein
MAFRLWRYQDGSVAMPGMPITRLADLPTAEALEAAVVAVHSQAESIRASKHSGLSNSVRPPAHYLLHGPLSIQLRRSWQAEAVFEKGASC